MSKRQISIKTTILICIFASALASCGLLPDRPAKWVHPTNTPAKIKSDHIECINEAWQHYPKKEGMVTEAEGYWDEGRVASTSCQYNKYSDRTNCTHSPGIERKWVNARIAMGDQNNKDRTAWYSGCMTTKDPQYKCVKGFHTLDGRWCGYHGEKPDK